MGKSTALIKLYETETKSPSIIKSHWIIGIKLRDHLEAIGDLQEDGIGIVNVVEFLTKIDLKLNNNLAKYLLKIALDKRENFQARSLLFIFDGFDEVLDQDYRKRILLLLQFIKDKTAAKLWITTRCHFKKLLEENLSTIAIQFSPMDDAENSQYIATYLRHHLFLTLNKEKYTELFDAENNETIHMYTAAFFNKMKSIFRGDIATFIGTPLQLYLMIEGAEGEFKNWIEKGDGQTVDFNYVGQDIYEVYERFTERKYGVYFKKVGIPEGIQSSQEKKFLDQYHKDFAKFRILESKQKNSLDEFSDKILLAGIIKSDDSNFQFIHKTFEEFFAAKVLIHWIEKVPNKFPNRKKQEHLLEVILMKSDYQLIRIFMNLQLQKMTKQARHNELLKHYGNIVATMHNEKRLVDDDGKTPLYVAVEEGNKAIAYFLLNSLTGQPDVLENFLFTSVKYGISLTNSHRGQPDLENPPRVIDLGPINILGTPLHLACKGDDVEIIRILLKAAARISEDTLQKFLRYLNKGNQNALTVAARYCHNVQIFKELLSKANNKLDLILNLKSPLCTACYFGNEKFVEFLFEEFKNEDCLENSSLKKILLHNSKYGNALCYARSATIIEKLICAAKSMKDNNETLMNLLFPEEGPLPLHQAVAFRDREIVEKLLNVDKEIDDDTLKQLLLHKRYRCTPLHLAAQYGKGDIINLLLETASNLDIEILEKLITAVDEQGKNAIELMFQYGHGNIFVDSFKMLQEDKYENIRKKVKEMYDNVRREISLHEDKTKLIMAIKCGDIQKVKDILSNAKNSSVNPNESLRILLLSENKCENSTLYIACKERNIEIMKELLSCAKEIDDDTLKELLLHDRYGKTSLHVAAETGYGAIINLLLETASNLDIEILEKLITAVDEEGKNAIELMFQYGHEHIFVDSFKMLQEDKYENIRKKVKEMLDNVPLESRLYWDKKKLIMAIESGDIQKVKDILSNAKNSSVNTNEILRILLLSKNECGNSTLYIACKEGNTEIMKELLSYAKEMDDGNHILKQLLLLKRNGKSALHVAAEKGHVNITKLLLKTASCLGIDILKELIFSVNKKGKNAILLVAEHDHETIFSESFKMLKDEYPIIWEKVMEMYDNIPFERTLYSNKKKLIVAIERGDIETVKYILNKVKNSSVNPNESLRFLLLSKNMWGYSTLHTACKEGNTVIMKELLSYAMNMDDGGATLKELLTKPTDMSPLTPLKELKHGYASEIKQILDSLIVEARNNNRDHVVNILKQINNQYSEESDDVSEGRVYVEYFRLTSSEDSDS